MFRLSDALAPNSFGATHNERGSRFLRGGRINNNRQ
jgi:hypothetical protein